jgi:hypothetical protein
MIKYISPFAIVDKDNMLTEPPKFRNYSEAMRRLLYASVIDYYYNLIADCHYKKTGKTVCRSEEQD